MFRMVTGVIVLCIGLWLVYVGVRGAWPVALYGVLAAAVGLAIICNKKEDEIEEITRKEDETT